MKFIFLRLYVLTAMLHLIFLAQQNVQLENITKYFLMPLLMAHVIFYEHDRWKDHIRLLTALLFCWAGDILLIYTDRNENFFLFGLAAFLIGHIFYMFAFIRSTIKTTTYKKRPYAILIPVCYAIILFSIIEPGLDDFMIPVFFYAVAITIMLIMAIKRFGRTNKYSFYFTLSGAILFILSDSTIAINKFLQAFSAASLLIMSTYIIAQYLIVTGLLLHEPSEEVD